MRILTDEEMEIFLAKLKKFVGNNLKLLFEQEDKENPYVFRMIGKKVYYMQESLLKQASVFNKKQLILCGVCMGQFSKINKFRIHITALDILHKLSNRKVFLK
jgi:60S ribosome subunit biogenesis protein NIP7